MDIDDLFRKLEGAVIDPSPAAGRLLMKKLAAREFLRFNAARFNIYYAGLVTLMAATVLYFVMAHRPAPPVEDNSLLPPATGMADTLVIPGGSAISVKGETERQIGRIAAVPSGYGTYAESSEKGLQHQKGSVSVIRQDYVLPEMSGNKTPAGPRLFKADPGAKLLRPGSDFTGTCITSSVKSGCVPLRVGFTTGSVEADSYSWSFGDGGTSVEPAPEWIYLTEGEFRVVLTLLFKDGTVRSETATINVYGKPNARFEILPLNPVIPDDEIRFVNYSSGAVSYVWDFGDGGTSDLFAPAYRYSSFANYDVSLTAISEKGCSDTLLISDAFGETGYFIDFPNAFIPNTGGPSDGRYTRSSDERAHIFHPEYSGVTEFSLKIFSKAGILVFETNDINIGWDGYYKGRLSSPGVYVWKVSGSFANGEPFAKTGDLIMIRNGF